MKERRKAKRIKDINEVTLTVISGGKKIPTGKSFYNYSGDISVTGAKIQANILLPVDTLLKMDFTLKTLQKQITALGKVKWVKVIIEDEYYEAGVEFIDTPGDAIKKIKDYISNYKKNKHVHMPFWIFAKFNEPKSK
ncbi:MAG: PilZ domain-containing protein [Syntrophaceae bacterium]|nr:PilZ domain-containing protein [Syntrophaceae bacterium]